MLYVWAKNASRLDLPEGVGFYLKGGSHLVLSLHYKGISNLPKNVTPGVNVIVTSKRPPKRAGTFMMVNSFDSIEPHSTGKFSIAQEIGSSDIISTVLCMWQHQGSIKFRRDALIGNVVLTKKRIA